MSDFDYDLFRDLGIFVAKATTTTKSSHGRLSGGVLVLVRKVFTVRGANVRGCGQCGSITNEGFCLEQMRM